jgi:hypothetical protein
MIDYLSDECPYCGSVFESLKENPIQPYEPLYSPKTSASTIQIEKGPATSQENNFWIILGGTVAPLSIFLWLLGDNGQLALIIKTSYMPLISGIGICSIMYGLFSAKKN